MTGLDDETLIVTQVPCKRSLIGGEISSHDGGARQVEEGAWAGYRGEWIGVLLFRPLDTSLLSCFSLPFPSCAGRSGMRLD
ncbi:hypothetical protein ABZT06_49875 [Streptomyces sp. NPDC005483]|uniref:hypothetical protein n=1 Tax=Streptomyces sp. NPDC005483 TaxID=3154882 RepID=UPI0033B76DDF